MLSVIVPTYNRNDLLDKCLEKLSPACQTLNSEEYEVLVLDDSKENKAKELVENKYPWARWVSGPKKGPAANRNYGAKNAKGDWFIFIDDDCLPLPELLRTYYQAIISGKYSALEGAIISDREKQRFDEEAPVNLKGESFWSCNIAIKADVFWRINGFDEDFPFAHMEDIDLYRRVKQVTQPFFLENAKVLHPLRRVVPFKSYKKWIYSNKYYIRKLHTKKDIKFRIVRLKIWVAILISDMRELKKYSFKGTGYFFEKALFNFLMIFI